MGAGFTGSRTASAAPAVPVSATAETDQVCPLSLVDFQPKSMLHVKETRVPRPRYPVVDFHSHLGWVRSNDGKLTVTQLRKPEQVIELMDRKGIQLMVHLTGGSGSAFDENLAYWQTPHPDRFAVFVQPWFDRIKEANYSRILAEDVERAAKAGARGLKVLKTLGLFLREDGSEGPLVKVDDPRFDEMWEVAAAYNLPVAIHTSDPEAFFLAIDRFNERFEELNAHPDWSFYGKDFPSDRELQEARLRVIKRHPKTTFVALHVASSENLDYTSECLRLYPNMHTEIGARVGELGRQPRRSRRFFEEFQDRIMFGTDAVPDGYETPQQVFVDELYEIYYRFLETDDEYFDYAPAPTPPQGRWRIYGIDLPDSILKKVYYENAARLLRMPPLKA
jgi:predicted TIM-barrel fold metal-dependent hydrolase